MQSPAAIQDFVFRSLTGVMHCPVSAHVRSDLRLVEFPESSRQAVKGTDEQGERREVGADDKRCRVVHRRSQGQQRRSAHTKRVENCLRGLHRLYAQCKKHYR